MSSCDFETSAFLYCLSQPLKLPANLNCRRRHEYAAALQLWVVSRCGWECRYWMLCQRGPQRGRGIHSPWSCCFRCPAVLIVTVTQVTLLHGHTSFVCNFRTAHCHLLAAYKKAIVLPKHVGLQAQGERLLDEFEWPDDWTGLHWCLRGSPRLQQWQRCRMTWLPL